MKEIYRGYSDTVVVEIAVNIKCPYCGYEWQEEKTECGETYVLTCTNFYEDLGEGCGKQFKMHFDAD